MPKMRVDTHFAGRLASMTPGITESGNEYSQ